MPGLAEDFFPVLRVEALAIWYHKCYCSSVIEIREYVDAGGRSPYARWFDRLDARAAAKVAMALIRMEQGNLSNAKGVGGGILKYRLDFGPGYRIYFGRDGDTLVILLGGGTKKRQSRDIDAAKHLWRDYRQRKRRETAP